MIILMLNFRIRTRLIEVKGRDANGISGPGEPAEKAHPPRNGKQPCSGLIMIYSLMKLTLY